MVQDSVRVAVPTSLDCVQVVHKNAECIKRKKCVYVCVCGKRVCERTPSVPHQELAEDGARQRMWLFIPCECVQANAISI